MFFFFPESLYKKIFDRSSYEIPDKSERENVNNEYTNSAFMYGRRENSTRRLRARF